MNDFLDLLRADGVVKNQNATLTPLSGGVSSEICRVDDGARRFVVKRALAKLKVRDDWFADVSRNRHEKAYIEYVARFCPEAVPALCGGSAEHGYFAMEFLGPEFANWKLLLLEGRCEDRHAILAAELIGAIHRHSEADREAELLFDTTKNFHQLRVEPYLLTTGARNPPLRGLFEAEAARIEATRECLVHGDFSPKNILIKGGRMVLLDCEVAWFGEPAFDVAFLLTHLFLKSLYHAPSLLGLSSMITQFWAAYVRTRGHLAEDFEARVGRLLLMLILSRVDGKSPVEYLVHAGRKQFAREFVYEHLPPGLFQVQPLAMEWAANLANKAFP